MVTETNVKVIGLVQAVITQTLPGEMNVIDAKSQKPVVTQEVQVPVPIVVARTVEEVVQVQVKIVVVVLIVAEIKDQCEAVAIEMTEIDHIKKRENVLANR